jgi:hypothetical protein
LNAAAASELVALDAALEPATELALLTLEELPVLEVLAADEPAEALLPAALDVLALALVLVPAVPLPPPPPPQAARLAMSRDAIRAAACRAW